MTRIEENGRLIDGMNKIVKNKSGVRYEEMVTFHLATMVTVLADISKSLAIIADKAERSDKE